MERKQKEQIIIVVTIIALVLMFIGISYAYFTSVNNERSGSSIVAVGGKMLINYDDGTDDIKPVTDIIPTNAILVNKTFSLTGTNTTTGITTGDGLAMPYKVGLKYTSTFSDDMLYYYIKEVNRVSTSKVVVEYTGEENQTVQGNETYTGYSKGTLKKGNRYTEMVTGEFPASDKDQTITFNLIIQFPDNNDNQDSEKGKTINGKIVVNDTPKATTFANDSWETIATIVQNGQLDAYPVGSEKEVEIDGTNYTVRVANNTTPDECSGTDFSQTACGFVVEFVDIVEERQINLTNTNVGGWEVSDIRTYLNDLDEYSSSGFLNKLPIELREVIIDTKVISGHGSTTNEENFQTFDKLYLLSPHEVWYNKSSRDSAYYDTRQLDYYMNRKVYTNSNYEESIKQYNNSNNSWWLRSAVSDNSLNYFWVKRQGNMDNNSANVLAGIAPAFRIE